MAILYSICFGVKWFPRKYFSAFGAYEKIQTAKNESWRSLPESSNVRLLSPDSDCTGRKSASLASNWQILPEFGLFSQIWPESVMAGIWFAGIRRVPPDFGN
jgi:hypothetical protein